MALQSGTMSVTIQYAQGISDRDWVFRQSPYCVISVGAQTMRTEVARDGGTSPVWNQTFQFEIINENDVNIQIKDKHELGHDEVVGAAALSLANARQMGFDQQNVPVYSQRTGAQHGFISVSLQWQPNGGGYYGQSGGYGGQQAMYGGGMQQGGMGMGMGMGYGGGMMQQQGGMGGMGMYGGGGMMQQQGMYDGGDYPPHHHHHHHHHRGGQQVEYVVIEENRW